MFQLDKLEKLLTKQTKALERIANALEQILKEYQEEKDSGV